MTAPPSDWQTLELRPRRSPILRRNELKSDRARMLVLVISLPLSVLILLSAARHGNVAAFVFPIAFVTIFFPASFVVMRRMRLRVRPDAIERVGGLPAKRVSRADVIGVVRVPIETMGMQEGQLDLLVSHQGRCLFRTRGRLWEDGDLDRAWAAAGLGIQLVEHPMSFQQLDDWIPGSARLYERRPFAFAFMVMGPLLALAIIALVAAVALHH